MKRKIILLFIVIIIIDIIFLTTYKNKNKTFVEISGVKLAITDGSGGQLSRIPVKGAYKVTVDCNNATGEWDYAGWQLVLKDVVDDTSCSLDFKQIDAMYLANFIKGEYTTKPSNGTNGYIVHENVLDYPNFSVSNIFTNYKSKTYSMTSSSSSQNGASYGSFWIYDNDTGVFTSNQSAMTTTSKYYHALLNIDSSGYYEVCYTIAQSPSTLNKIYINANSNVTSISSSTSSAISETCYNIGKVEVPSGGIAIIDISEYAYSGTSAPEMTFKIKKFATSEIDTGYRYEGKNVNNYVWFNNELWRIIGVFDTEYDTNNDDVTDGTKLLTKIIRNDILGAYVYDKTSDNGRNDWPNSSLYYLLNGAYYDWNTNKSTVDNYCISYAYQKTVVSKCDFSIIGIQDDYREMLVNAKWFSGGPGKDGYKDYYPISLYSYERNPNAIWAGNNYYSGNEYYAYGYVGLMSVSDYAFSTPNSTCPRGSYKADSYYDSTGCADNSWLFGTANYEWTISNYYSPNAACAINFEGNISYNSGSYGYTLRPVVYLNSNVYVVDGDGSIDNPYIIGMATN